MSDGGDVPTAFHAGLTMRHGTLRCSQCHAAPEGGGTFDYDALHLSDGAKVDVDDAMTLCAQCHGPQTRDYEHGSHGGMQGHWDLRYGPRERNQCIHCHDPHAPAYVGMVPAAGPRDRFLIRRAADPAKGGHSCLRPTNLPSHHRCEAPARCRPGPKQPAVTCSRQEWPCSAPPPLPRPWHR